MNDMRSIKIDKNVELVTNSKNLSLEQADSENRTRIVCLEGRKFTINLYPQTVMTL